MGKTFSEQCEIYRQQQTETGKRIQKALDQMVEKLKQKTGADVKSGTLIPMRNIYTEKITGFIER
ncbi:MAG: hypothetical protein IKS90_03465 [Clostridia bacterium]|nr:hypothetical protein [Clostridia bacterium]